MSNNTARSARPSVNVPRPAPRPICLPTGDLVEIPRAAPSQPPPLPPHRPSGAVPIARRRIVPAKVERMIDALASLDLQPDALAAGRLCVDALAEVIPCRAVLAHAFDAERRAFLVIHARGESASSMVLTSATNEDPLLRVAMPTAEPFAWRDLRRAPVRCLGRFADLANVRAILETPVVVGARWLGAGARWLGAFELVDPRSDRPFETEDALAARYVATRYATYLTAHGLVLDVARIARFANAHFAAHAVRLALGRAMARAR